MIPRGLPYADTTQYCWRSEENITYQDSSTYKWKRGIRGVEPRWRPAQTPRAHHERVIIPGADDLNVFTATQPQ